MRGKGIAAHVVIDGKGITPAYAGKSPHRQSVSHVLEDHPRLCGEKVFRSSAAFAFLGSPPPMRGKGVLFSTLYF